MSQEITSHHRNVATFIHLSTFSAFFIPFGNFIFPLILWLAQKNQSPFVDDHGRRALNFQISIFLYSILIVVIALPFIIWQAVTLGEINGWYFDFHDDFENLGSFAEVSGLLITVLIAGFMLLALFFIELVSVISAAVGASNGKYYKYPLCISFIGSSNRPTHQEPKAPSTESSINT